MRLDKHGLHKIALLKSLWRRPHAHADLLPDGIAEARVVWREEQALVVPLGDLLCILS